MRKLNEVQGDEFFDLIYAMSPIIPIIGDMEVFQAQFGSMTEKTAEAQAMIVAEKSKKTPSIKVVTEATRIIQAEMASMFVRDIAKVVPVLAKNHRDAVYEVLSLVDQVPISDVKKYPGPKLLSELYQLFRDTDFKSFLSYAEPSASGK